MPEESITHLLQLDIFFYLATKKFNLQMGSGNNKKKLSLAFDETSDLLYYTDPEGTILDLNLNAAAFSSVKLTAADKKNLLEFIPPRYRADLIRFMKEKDSEHPVLKKKLQLRNGKGKLFPFRCNLVHTGRKGNLFFILKSNGRKVKTGAARAVTKIEILQDLRENERKLQTLLGNLRGMAYRCVNEEKWPMEFVSQGSYELTGYRPEELQKGGIVNYGDLIHPEDRQYVWEEVQKTHKKHSRFEIEYRIIAQDGSIKWVWERGVFIREGKKESILEGFITDISKRKQAEQTLKEQFKELRLAKEKAEESDRLKSAFLANVSHEIRTPMNAIMGFAELLKDPEISRGRQEEFLTIILQSGKRMLGTLNDIIDISKIEAGEIQYHLEKTYVSDVLNEVHNFFLNDARKKGIKLLITCNLSKTEAIIYTDPHKFSAILMNLVKNAIKFTHKGSIEAGVNPDSGMLKFFVKDTGIGIPREKFPLIFKRFTQLNNGLSNAYEGTGLGLSISKAYAEMLGGRIWFDSEEGKGTTFYFTLPYRLNT